MEKCMPGVLLSSLLDVGEVLFYGQRSVARSVAVASRNRFRYAMVKWFHEEKGAPASEFRVAYHTGMI